MDSHAPGAFDKRCLALVIGPTAPGILRVNLRGRDRDVPVDVIPEPLRRPNSRFIAVMRGGTVVGVESDTESWLRILDAIVPVLNATWNPIGVPPSWTDEYDSYVHRLYTLLTGGATDGEIVDELGRIEVDRMGLSASAPERRAEVVRQLRALDLPSAGR